MFCGPHTLRRNPCYGCFQRSRVVLDRGSPVAAGDKGSTASTLPGLALNLPELSVSQWSEPLQPAGPRLGGGRACPSPSTQPLLLSPPPISLSHLHVLPPVRSSPALSLMVQTLPLALHTWALDSYSQALAFQKNKNNNNKKKPQKTKNPLLSQGLILVIESLVSTATVSAMP